MIKQTRKRLNQKKQQQQYKLVLFIQCTIISPALFFYAIPTLANQTNTLRYVDNMQAVNAHSCQHSNSFFSSTIRKWNSLPSVESNTETADNLKQHLNKGKVTVPRYFYTSSRNMQILHIRLSTGCSALNNDLFLKHHQFSTVYLSMQLNRKC